MKKAVKRRLAFLAAAAVAFAAMPAAGASAATTNNQPVNYLITAKTALFEPGSMNLAGNSYAMPGSVGNDTNVDYTKAGSDLVISPITSLVAGAMFKVNLSGAYWNLRSTQMNTNTGAGGTLPVYSAQTMNGINVTNLSPVTVPTSPISVTGPGNQNNNGGAFGYTDTVDGAANVGTTFDPTRGAWQAGAKYQGVGGDYYRFPLPAQNVQTNGTGITRWEIPYIMRVDPSNTTSATVQILATDVSDYGSTPQTSRPWVAANAQTINGYTAVTSYVGGNWDLVIPLSVLADGSGNAVSVSVQDANAGVTSQVFPYATVSNPRTNTYVINSTQKAVDTFKPNIVVQETQAGTMGGGYFYINAPYGFHWDLSNASVTMDPIFASNGSNYNLNTQNYRPGTATATDHGVLAQDNKLYWNLSTGTYSGSVSVTYDEGPNPADPTGVTHITHSDSIGTGDGSNDSRMLVVLQNITKSVSAAGSISIVGAFLYADSAIPYNYPVKLTVQNATAGVTNQSGILAGTRVYSVTDYPTKVTGRVTSCNPKVATTVQLLYNGSVVNSAQIAPADGNGQVTQDFEIDNVAPGTYKLVISKPAHATFTLNNLTVGEADVDLTLDSRPAVSAITLPCGDLDGDGMITARDLSILLGIGNYSKGPLNIDY